MWTWPRKIKRRDSASFPKRSSHLLQSDAYVLLRSIVEKLHARVSLDTPGTTQHCSPHRSHFLLFIFHHISPDGTKPMFQERKQHPCFKTSHVLQNRAGRGVFLDGWPNGHHSGKILFKITMLCGFSGMLQRKGAEQCPSRPKRMKTSVQSWSSFLFFVSPDHYQSSGFCKPISPSPVVIESSHGI